MTKTQEKIPKNPLKYMWFVVRNNKKMFFLTLFVATLAEFLGTSMALIFRNIIDKAEAFSSGGATLNEVWFWAMAFPLTLLFMDLLWRTSGFTGMRWMTAANARSYEVLFRHLGKHSHTYFSDRFAGSLSSKVTHASEGVQSLYESFVWNYYPGILALLLTVVYTTYLNLIAGLIFMGLLVILFPLNFYLARYRRPHVVKYSAQSTRTRGRLVDSITNMAAVRQYARHDFEQGIFSSEVQVMRKLNLKQWTISEWGLLTNNVVIGVFEIIIIYLVISSWSQGSLSTGELVMAISLLLNVNSTLIFIGNSINSFIRRYAEVEEGLTEVLDDHEIADAPDSKALVTDGGEIIWNNVDFEFADNKVFDGFNLKINPGQRIGLVGQSGAGKTTFVSLLLRQHNISGGQILIDGQDISTVTQDSLRENIAVVPQEPMLFHRSIRENILYGSSDATEADLVAATKKAQAHEFIESLSEGYDTMVGERGVKLSGGQKQRVAIARAILKDAPILVLDEATSALDSESEVAIQKALEGLMEGRTVIAVAHRLSTLRKMDRILVMKEGVIAEDGSHEELAVGGGTYQKLWEHQAGGFLEDND